MSKIGRKLFVGLCLILLSIFTTSFFINNFLVEKYLNYKINNEIVEVVEYVKANSEINIVEIEKNHDVVIVIDDMSKDNDYLNESLRFALDNKRVRLNKFWIVDETFQKVKAGAVIRRNYNQDKIKANFLVNIFELNGCLYVIGKSYSDSGLVIDTINRIHYFMILCSLLASFIFIWIFTNRFVKPLLMINNISQEIASLNFLKTDYESNDEIGLLAYNINKMSDELKLAQSSLNNRNKNLKAFISNMSHEFKTPLALIKAYCIGIKDGYDDGSYTNVILRRVDELSNLVDELLIYSKTERASLKIQELDICVLVNESIDRQELLLEENKHEIVCADNLDLTILIEGDLFQVQQLINNLLENAIKYTSDRSIFLSLTESDIAVKLTISNKISKQIELDKIWEPFYTTDDNRRSTGIGLPIVKSILENHGYSYETKIEDDYFFITVSFRKSIKNNYFLY